MSQAKKFIRPRNFDYNVLVLGAGTAGLMSATFSRFIRGKVALIEGQEMGGDCLNTGCVPSKALIHAAKRCADAKGLAGEGHVPDLVRVLEQVQSKIARIAPHDSVEHYSEMGVGCFRERGTLISPWEIRLASGKVLSARSIILATGAEPFIPAIEGIDSVAPLTSDTIWKIKRPIKAMVILGGGPIGCELAMAFQRLGVKVHIVESAAQLLSQEDQEVSSVIEKKFIAEGIQIHLATRAKSFSSTDGVKKLVYEKSALKGEIIFDEVLIAVGRKGRTRDIGLEMLLIDLTPKGTIRVNRHLQTSVPSIYACGDVVGPYQFTHTAAHQAWPAAFNALFGFFLPKMKVDYSAIPAVTFVDPEVARVGLNEKLAKEKKLAYEVVHFSLSEVDRAIVDSAEEGFIKIILKKNSSQILGVTIVSARAGDMLAEWTLAMQSKLNLNHILNTVHPYPTYSELSRYAAYAWKKSKTPGWFFKVCAWIQSKRL